VLQQPGLVDAPVLSMGGGFPGHYVELYARACCYRRLVTVLFWDGEIYSAYGHRYLAAHA
jgi:hypothetical protein